MPRSSQVEPMPPDEKPGATPGVEIITFGCRLNAFESEVIARAAAGAGLADAVIVNTCAVTAEAERQARQAIRRARREHPDARIIVTGCAATLTPERYAAIAEVDLVLDNEAKLRTESYVAEAPRPIRSHPGPPRSLPRLRGRDGWGHYRPGRRPVAQVVGRAKWRPASAPTSRCSRAATIAARSASSPMRAAPAARCRSARSSTRRAAWWRAAVARSC